MPSTTVRSLLAAVILLVGIGAIYTRSWASSSLVPPSDGMTYVTDMDFWYRTASEQVVHARTPLDLSHDLQDIPMQLGAWIGEDVPQTNVEVFALLEPEQYIQRLYRNDTGNYLWLSLIGGRTSRTFHPPDICYDTDGWSIALQSRSLPLPSGGEIHGMWLDAEKDEYGHRVFYFYIFPDSVRNSDDGILQMKLTAGAEGSMDETLQSMEDFLGHLFQNTMSSRL